MELDSSLCLVVTGNSTKFTGSSLKESMEWVVAIKEAVRAIQEKDREEVNTWLSGDLLLGLLILSCPSSEFPACLMMIEIECVFGRNKSVGYPLLEQVWVTLTVMSRLIT